MKFLEIKYKDLNNKYLLLLNDYNTIITQKNNDSYIIKDIKYQLLKIRSHISYIYSNVKSNSSSNEISPINSCSIPNFNVPKIKGKLKNIESNSCIF